MTQQQPDANQLFGPTQTGATVVGVTWADGKKYLMITFFTGSTTFKVFFEPDNFKKFMAEAEKINNQLSTGLIIPQMKIAPPQQRMNGSN